MINFPPLWFFLLAPWLWFTPQRAVVHAQARPSAEIIPFPRRR